MHLLIHGFDPLWILGCLGKCFRLSVCGHVHHKGIMICHILIVTESSDRVFLSGGVTELLVGGVYGFLRVIGLYKSIEALKLNVD